MQHARAQRGGQKLEEMIHVHVALERSSSTVWSLIKSKLQANQVII